LGGCAETTAAVAVGVGVIRVSTLVKGGEQDASQNAAIADKAAGGQAKW
jgi:hypothetical protein